jgi:hypothetical protein
MPAWTTKPLTPDQALAYRLAAAVKKFIDPGLGFSAIRMVPAGTAAGRFSLQFRVPARPDPDEPRGLRVVVRGAQVRVDFRRGRWSRGGAFDASDPEFERAVAEFIGRHWNCYFSTYWMGA